MPKSKATKTVGTYSESKSVIQLPCGYMNTVKSTAAEMYARMHRKGCSMCRQSKTQTRVTELFAAGGKCNASSSIEEAKKMADTLTSDISPNDINVESLISMRSLYTKQSDGS